MSKEQKSNLVLHAERELSRLVKDNDKMQLKINENVLEIIELFAKQGHSGMSAFYLIGVLNKLMRFKPLTPLTGEDEEWCKGYETPDGFSQQNIRYSKVFRRNRDNSTASVLDAKLFSGDGGKSWFGNGNSRASITFPFKDIETQYFLVDEDGEVVMKYNKEEVK